MQEQQKSANDLAAERTDLAHERTEAAVQRTDLAIERSVMAANRTLMAWIRTALSMIGFGFTIYKVLQATLNEALPQITGKAAFVNAKTPMRVGLFLIVLGTLSIILGTMEYVHTMKHLDKLTKREYKPWNFSTLAGLAVGLLGVILIVSIITHRELF